MVDGFYVVVGALHAFSTVVGTLRTFFNEK